MAFSFIGLIDTRKPASRVFLAPPTLWDKIPIPPTFYIAAPSRCIKPYSNESFDGMLQIKTGVKLVADQRMC